MRPTPTRRPRCRSSAARPSARYENRTVGYDVVYEYAGRRYTTRWRATPDPTLEIDVRPVGAVAERRPPAPLPRRAAAAARRLCAGAGRSPRRRWSTSSPAVGYYGEGYYVGPPAPSPLVLSATSASRSSSRACADATTGCASHSVGPAGPTRSQIRRYFALISATVVSSMRFEKPHSLSYQLDTLTSAARRPWSASRRRSTTPGCG